MPKRVHNAPPTLGAVYSVLYSTYKWLRLKGYCVLRIGAARAASVMEVREGEGEVWGRRGGVEVKGPSPL